MKPITSAGTSVNKTKVPQLFTWAVEKGIIKPGMAVFDYGCGRWPETVRAYLSSHGVDNLDQWDPNWFPEADYIPCEGYDAACLSNVLNVIDGYLLRHAALRAAWDSLRPGGVLLVTVYEADGSGASGPSRDGCWQERRPLPSYVDRELAPYLGRIIPGTRLWVSFPKPAEGEKWYPPIGTKCTISRPFGGSETPCTVVGIDKGRVVVRMCRLEFDGPRYYDTIADRIVPALPGETAEIALTWRPKYGEWQEPGKYGGYVIFGRWSHQPYLD